MRLDSRRQLRLALEDRVLNQQHFCRVISRFVALAMGAVITTTSGLAMFRAAREFQHVMRNQNPKSLNVSNLPFAKQRFRCATVLFSSACGANISACFGAQPLRLKQQTEKCVCLHTSRCLKPTKDLGPAAKGLAS